MDCGSTVFLSFVFFRCSYVVCMTSICCSSSCQPAALPVLCILKVKHETMILGFIEHQELNIYIRVELTSVHRHV